MSRGQVFPYKRIDGRFRPIIPVEFSRDSNIVRYEVLVDSGADICVLHADVGRALGLDIESGEEFEMGGVTGSPRIGHFHIVTIKIGRHTYRTKVGFMDTMRDDAFGMVGQKGFFDRFAIKFDYAERKLILHKKQWL